MFIVVDSSGWIEYVQGGPNAATFAPVLRSHSLLVVPTVVVYEVTRYLRREVSDEAADQTLARMEQSVVADLDFATATEAARIGLAEKLAIADSIILATARAHGATLWTQDAHFRDVPGVRYVPKPIQ
jgi:predicted nucleic acid-binding protein